MFYNEMQKNRFIMQSDMPDDSKEVLMHMFKGAARIESKNKMDLADFNRPQVVNLLKSYNSGARNYLRLMCSYYSRYYSWCLSEKLIDITNVTNWYDYSLSKSIIEEVVPTELIKGKYFGEEEVKNEYLQKIIDPTNKFIAYALFSGIRGENYENLISLRMEDLNEKRKTIQLISGKIINVNDLFIKLMKDADEATHYYPNGVTGYNNKEFLNEYDQSVYVLKMSRSKLIDKKMSQQVVVSRIGLIKKQTGNKYITATTLYQNGLISYIKTKYKEQGISFHNAIYNEINKKLYTYDKQTEEYIEEYGSNMTARMLRMQLKDIIEYYE